MRGWFVTGTDTGVGKTTVAAALLWSLGRGGHACAGMKPVATGCRRTAAGLHSDDAERLRSCSSVEVDPDDASPYRFTAPVAPHLAAQAAGTVIELERIRTHFERLRRRASCVVVEGIGGWLVPLGAGTSMAELARSLRLPVILVVGMRLGCLNHALLTAASVHHYGLRLAAWVANQVDPEMSLFNENVEALRQRIDAPLLGVLPHLMDGGSPRDAAAHLRLSPLLGVPEGPRGG